MCDIEEDLEQFITNFCVRLEMVSKINVVIMEHFCLSESNNNNSPSVPTKKSREPHP